MDDEHEDVKLLTKALNKKKLHYNMEFEMEMYDFIYFESDIDECENSTDEEYTNDEFTPIAETESIVDLELPREVNVSELSPEDREIIDECQDPDLKQLLFLNRTKDLLLRQLRQKVHDLILNADEIFTGNISERNELHERDDLRFTQTWKVSAPYFKDRKFFAVDANPDTVLKQARNELSMYDAVPSLPWIPIEFDRLLSAVKSNYNTNRQIDVKRKINALKSAEDSQREDVERLNEELERLKHDKSVPGRDSDQFVNWTVISEKYLKDKHTANECKAVWHMLVHPDLNATKWSAIENKKLVYLVKKYKAENWEEIAKKLGTNRSALMTCIHYFRNVSGKLKKFKFSDEEDARIMEMVDLYKMDDYIPWALIVKHFPNRSRHQLYHRYTYFLAENDLKKGKFTEAEDILLLVLINRYGKNFKKCAEFMPTRTQVQLKSRWNSNLQKYIKKGRYTEHDDKMIVDFALKHKEQDWSALALKMNRCNAQLRRRYKVIKSFLEANPEANLCDIPKRRHNFSTLSGEDYDFILYMADYYKDAESVPTLAMIEEVLQVEKRAQTIEQSMLDECHHRGITIKNIDTMLMEALDNIQNGPTGGENINEACENADEVLGLLGAQLTLPENYELNIHLDSIDEAILAGIKNNKGAQHDCVPPNPSTLSGLKSLIIKHVQYKRNALPLRHNHTLDNICLRELSEVLEHRGRFDTRFRDLFGWSALLSVEQPNEVLTASCEVAVEDEAPVVKKRRTFGNRKTEKQVEKNVAAPDTGETSLVQDDVKLLDEMLSYEKARVSI